MSLTAHIALTGARITTSLYALSLHASEFTVGLLISLFSLFPMLFAIPAGRLIDRVGILRPMLAGAAAMVLGCALAGMIAGLPVLYLGTILIGTGFMMIQIASQHTVGAFSSTARRSSNFSWLALGFSISGFCGPVLAGFIIDHARHSIAYITFCGFAAMAFALAASLGSRHMATLPHADGSAAKPGPASAIDLLRDTEMRRIYAIGVLLSAAWDLFTFVMPIHGTHLGLPASTIGMILGCFAAATFTVRLAMPWIGRRLTEWQVLAGALLLAVVCYLLFPFTARPLTLTVVAATLGLAVGASQPNMLALLHLAAPPGRTAEAVGMRITIGNACQVVLPLAFGGAGTALGLSVVFWGMGAMMATGLPLAWRKAIR